MAAGISSSQSPVNCSYCGVGGGGASTAAGRLASSRPMMASSRSPRRNHDLADNGSATNSPCSSAILPVRSAAASSSSVEAGTAGAVTSHAGEKTFASTASASAPLTREAAAQSQPVQA